LGCLGDGRAEELDEEADPEVEQRKNHPNSSLTEPPISEDSGKKSTETWFISSLPSQSRKSKTKN
jgi:hypothetical protein